MIGAAFAPQLRQIVTLEGFAAPETGWYRTAVELLLDFVAVAEKGTVAELPEVDTAFAWFEEHQDALPTPLRTWREAAEEARKRATKAPPSPPGRRGGDPASRGGMRRPPEDGAFGSALGETMIARASTHPG